MHFDYDDTIYIEGEAIHPDLPNFPNDEEIFDFQWSCEAETFDLWPQEKWLSIQHETPCHWYFDKAGTTMHFY